MSEDPIRANNALWDEWAVINSRSEFYDLAGFIRGGIRLRDYELAEIGSVEGKDVLHLQCHFGMDTLSFSRLGARVTGADFSQAALAKAAEVATEIGVSDATWVHSDLYDLPSNLEGDFDLVYTSRGVLGWLPDMKRWAQVAAHFVRPGGLFYVTEIHPVANAFENEGVALGELRLEYPYWSHSEAMAFPVQGSYADTSAVVHAPTEYGWDHSLGEIVTALIDAGLVIRSLREYPFVEWPIDFLVDDGTGRFHLPPDTKGELPLFFSILATKPA